MNLYEPFRTSKSLFEPYRTFVSLLSFLSLLNLLSLLNILSLLEPLWAFLSYFESFVTFYSLLKPFLASLSLLWPFEPPFAFLGHEKPLLQNLTFFIISVRIEQFACFWRLSFVDFVTQDFESRISRNWKVFGMFQVSVLLFVTILKNAKEGWTISSCSRSRKEGGMLKPPMMSSIIIFTSFIHHFCCNFYNFYWFRPFRAFLGL